MSISFETDDEFRSYAKETVLAQIAEDVDNGTIVSIFAVLIKKDGDSGYFMARMAGVPLTLALGVNRMAEINLISAEAEQVRQRQLGDLVEKMFEQAIESAEPRPSVN